MSRKPKFRPVITRVKLNPEQAVLTCTCYNRSDKAASGGYWAFTFPVNTCDASPGAPEKSWSGAICQPGGTLYAGTVKAATNSSS